MWGLIHFLLPYKENRRTSLFEKDKHFSNFLKCILYFAMPCTKYEYRNLT